MVLETTQVKCWRQRIFTEAGNIRVSINLTHICVRSYSEYSGYQAYSDVRIKRWQIPNTAFSESYINGIVQVDFEKINLIRNRYSVGNNVREFQDSTMKIEPVVWIWSSRIISSIELSNDRLAGPQGPLPAKCWPEAFQCDGYSAFS